jgi:hypothetical protein
MTAPIDWQSTAATLSSHAKTDALARLILGKLQAAGPPYSKAFANLSTTNAESEAHAAWETTIVPELVRRDKIARSVDGEPLLPITLDNVKSATANVSNRIARAAKLPSLAPGVAALLADAAATPVTPEPPFFVALAYQKPKGSTQTYAEIEAALIVAHDEALGYIAAVTAP